MDPNKLLKMDDGKYTTYNELKKCLNRLFKEISDLKETDENMMKLIQRSNAIELLFEIAENNNCMKDITTDFENKIINNKVWGQISMKLLFKYGININKIYDI